MWGQLAEGFKIKACFRFSCYCVLMGWWCCFDNVRRSDVCKRRNDLEEFVAAYFDALSMYLSRRAKRKQNIRRAGRWTPVPNWYLYNTSTLTLNIMEKCSSWKLIVVLISQEIFLIYGFRNFVISLISIRSLFLTQISPFHTHSLISSNTTLILSPHIILHHSVHNLLLSSFLSKSTNINIFRTVILPVLCGCESHSLILR